MSAVEGEGTRALKKAPRASGHPLFGVLPQLRVDPLGTLMKTAALGDVVDLGARHRRMVELTTPALVREVLQGGWREFPRARFSLRPLLGQGLVTTEGPTWQARRRLLQPIFSNDQLGALAPQIGAMADAMLDGWKEGRAIDAADESSRLALRIALRTLFGAEVDPEEERRITEAVNDGLAFLNDRLWVPVRTPLWLPTRKNRRFHAARDVLHDVTGRIIKRRRAAGGDATDMIGWMLAARDGDQGASDDVLRDEAVTMLVAGHDTIAAGLAWTLYFLGRHPEHQRHIREEARAAAESLSKPTMATLRLLRWTNAVFCESMRLYPPIWLFTRVASKDVVLGDYAIAKGTVTIVSSYVIHRMASVWDEPEVFRPERFLDKKPNELPKGSYLPFGWGPHMCIGAGFAMIQAQLVVAKVCARFALEQVDAQHVPKPRPHITMRPDSAIMMMPRSP